MERMFNPRIETLPRRELEELQLRRLRHVVRRCYDRIPFYRRKMREAGISPDDIRSLDDIEKLPFTTKQDLRDSYPFGFLAVPREEVVEIHASSGTTGKPVLSFYTERDLENWAEIMARCLAMSGLTKEDVFQITPGFGLFSGGFGFYHGARKIGAFIVPTGSGNSRRQIQLMLDLGTTMIAGIASYALRLAEVAQEMGVDPARDTRVRKGIFGAEMWSDELRRKIERIWDMDSYDIYGMAETYGPGLANDCAYHDGLHVWEDHFLIEIVDPETLEPVEPEEEGELVVTTLTKDAMPLLRFRTRDITFLYDSTSCDCGRTHRRIGRIKGRTDDALKVKGILLFPSELEKVIMSVDGVGTNYQIVVRREGSLDELLIRVEAENGSIDKKRVADEIEKRVREFAGIRPRVEVLDPLSIPRPEGKAKRVIDERYLR